MEYFREDGFMRFSRLIWLILGASALLAQPAESPSRRVFPRGSTDDSIGVWHARPPLWTRGRYLAAPPTTTTGEPYVTPSQMASIYGIEASSSWPISATPTLAIVDAYDSPNAETDLGVFCMKYGLPSCTTANGCFSKVNQNGGKSVPRRNAGWESEINLDTQWAHAIAPYANILLVEANSSSDVDLFAAVNYAKQHASVVSMSWSGPEWQGQSYYDNSVFKQTGVTFLAASGDSDAEVGYPAASANVIAVGGTKFATNSQGYVVLPATETGWTDQSGGSGGGCSVYTPQPPFQKKGPNGSWVPSATCTMRGIPDVAMDADPASGVLVYISRQGGWWTYGGTSLACPMFAGIIVNVNSYRASTWSKSTVSAPLNTALADLYAAADANYGMYFNDIKSGGSPFSSGPNWDFVTGLGSPKAGPLMSYLGSAKQ
jgi:subtilase family serine protease